MFSKFLDLNRDKQDRILNAALKEFAQKGYQNASTNEIIKAAGISKGLLFHYFSNKKSLYLFLFDHFIEMVMREIHEKVNWNQHDIFCRYREIAMRKFDLFLRYPEVFNFIKTIYTEKTPDVKIEIESRIKDLLKKGYKDFFSDIDFSKFKEGIDIERTVHIIYWTLEGYSNSQQDKVAALQLDHMNIDEILAEMDHYCEILRKAFYK